MIRTLFIGILATTMIARADQAADALTHAGIAGFSAAYQAWDGEGFAKAARQFSQAAAKSPKSATNYYWQGTASFHQMLQLQSMGKNTAADHPMEGAIHAFETAVALDPHHAESHALLGTLYGMKIQGGILRAIRFGPRVQEHQKQALHFGAHNPRVRYLLGAGRFHVAKNAAAHREALDTLLAAEKLFLEEAKRPAKPFEPRWGLSSCRTFIGRTYLKLGDRAHAAEYFKKALAEHPNDHIAKEQLAKITPH
ncbi:MAG: tetratricopeptide repeat protein [Verrucomicrobiaceae bacterium]|nr:MAG: tetratricopeptide repeat protein [Verrucomicrobiaceae bacterium]